MISIRPIWGSLAIVRQRREDADAWILDTAQAVVAAIAVIALPIGLAMAGVLDVIMRDHAWLLLVLFPVVAASSLAYTHVRLEPDRVVIRRCWLGIPYRRAVLAPSARFDVPIQERDQVYYGSERSFPAAGAERLRDWLNDQLARIDEPAVG
jgi:hypothetical protein